MVTDSTSHAIDHADLWHAMSELYLDDGYDVGVYLFLANRLARSEFSLTELDTIFFQEVHPTLWWNLTLVAGEWGYFDKDRVVRLATEAIAPKLPEQWWKRLRYRQKQLAMAGVKEMVKCEWEQILLLIEVIRTRGLRDHATD